MLPSFPRFPALLWSKMRAISQLFLGLRLIWQCCFDFVIKMASSVINRRDYMKHIRASYPKNPKIFISDPNIYIVASVCLKELFVRANGDSVPPPSKDVLDATSKPFIDYVRTLYRGKHRTYEKMLKLPWFDESVEFKKPTITPPTPPPTPQQVPQKPPSKKAKLSFSEMGQRQKDRTTAKIRAENEDEAIVAAAVQVFRSKGQNDAAFVVRNLFNDENADQLAKKLRKIMTDNPEEFEQKSKPQCLAFLLDRGITRVDWEKMCKLINSTGKYLVPCYSELAKAKKELH